MLSRNAPELVSIETTRNDRFITRLRLELRNVVLGHIKEPFDEIVNLALRFEDLLA